MTNVTKDLGLRVEVAALYQMIDEGELMSIGWMGEDNLLTT